MLLAAQFALLALRLGVFWKVAHNNCYTPFHAPSRILNPSQPFIVHIRAREFKSHEKDRTSLVKDH
jgi:hypothetical protein